MRSLKLFGLGAALVLGALVAVASGTAQKVITVCQSGCDFSSIKAAILAAPENSVIHVKAGTYKESLVILKPLSLVGEGRDKTIIEGGIAILETKLVNVTGFTIRGQGIQVQDSQTVLLADNLIDQSSSSGLLIANSLTVAVQGSTIQNSTGSGMIIVLGSKAIISANTIKLNGSHGISVGASQADLRDNLITDNGGCGITADSASQLSGSGNTGYGNAGGNACGNVPSGLIAQQPPQPPSMALIPAGSFKMGDDAGEPDERPAHTVYLSAFYIDKVEVTYGFWNEVASWAADNGYDISPRRVEAAQANHPVTYMTWYEAVKWANARSEREGLKPCYYVDRLQQTVYRTGDVDVPIEGVKWSGCGYRLPTEAEWEKAARGGLEGKRYPWGDEEISCSRANYSGCRGSTAPVGSYPPNGYELYDMAGNEWEWVWDWYNPGYYGASPGTNPLGPPLGESRVLRGGSWGSDASDCRVANRDYASPSSHYGFRLVRAAGQ